MVRITKVYTRQGDQGTTRLAGGQEVSKRSQRIEAYGTVDELNAYIGLALQALTATNGLSSLKQQLLKIQHELFNLGSQLAVLPQDRRENTPRIASNSIQRLEAEIDTMNAELAPLTSFILPGGGNLSINLHLARTVCRRAERRVLDINDGYALDGTELPYLNRLSDWLFVSSRYASQNQGFQETLWEPSEEVSSR